MKGSPQVIEALNAVLTVQLTAINQTFLAAKVHEHRGFTKLGRAAYKHSIQVMKHAEPVIARVLFLDGLPNLQRMGKIAAAEDSTSQIAADCTLQSDLCARLEALAHVALEANDHASAELAESLLVSAQQTLLAIETQLRELQTLGENIFLSQQLHDAG
ncbi:MAG: ferritin-like domain-containing protein [Deltaproteobacteria bacterium]|nr:ferritin-like domain-containing protein [Deltaproteobacteria bacterium]